MKAVILHGNSKDDAAENAIHGMLCEALRARGWETETKPLAQMRVGPCLGCFNCWFKTPGECAIDDDGREVAAAVANCAATRHPANASPKHFISRTMIDPPYQRRKC